jgi:hypothetical protein
MTGRVQELFVRSDGREIRASHDIVEAVAASTSSHFEDPLDEPCWGAALSVYALRSATSYGIGDLGDLRSAARILAGLGARFCTISPVGMWSALPTFEYYPYSPGSRLFIDPVYLSLPHLGIRPDSTQPTTWQEARNGKLALIQALVLDHPEYLRADDFRLWLQAQPRARAAGLYIIEACDGRIQTRTAQEASDRAKGLDDAGLIADPRTWSWAA